MGFEFVHVAVVVVAATQAHPLLLAAVGKVPKLVPVGIATVSVITPVVGAVPMLLTVTGKLLGWSATGLGLG